MKRIDSSYVQSAPVRRPLKIFASDPMIGSTAPRRITIEINNEPMLAPGPSGERLEVVDYDGAHNRFYPPVNLNDAAILMQNGLDPTESDPRFHQQMVYAVASKTLENFDSALGRQLPLKRNNGQKLRLFPHAFHGANAFYAPPPLHAILFGHFRADRKSPGQNMPGRIFSPVSRTTPSSIDCAVTFSSRATATCLRFTKGSPTSSRCSSIFRIANCSAKRSRECAPISAATTCS